MSKVVSMPAWLQPSGEEESLINVADDAGGRGLLNFYARSLFDPLYRLISPFQTLM